MSLPICSNFCKPKRQALARSWAGVFRDHLLKHLPVAELASNFLTTQGRGNKDLHAVLRALILQQLHDLILPAAKYRAVCQAT